VENISTRLLTIPTRLIMNILSLDTSCSNHKHDAGL
jgi:hypothetical protein